MWSIQVGQTQKIKGSILLLLCGVKKINIWGEWAFLFVCVCDRTLIARLLLSPL